MAISKRMRQPRDVAAAVRWLLEVAEWDKEKTMDVLVKINLAITGDLKVPSCVQSQAVTHLLDEIYRAIQPKESP